MGGAFLGYPFGILKHQPLSMTQPMKFGPIVGCGRSISTVW